MDQKNFVITAPVKLPREKIKEYLAINEETNSEYRIEDIFDKVEAVAKPKAIYRIAYVNKRESDMITIDEVIFHSKVMGLNLDKVNRVFPYIATSGIELEKFHFKKADILEQYWLHSIKYSLLNIIRNNLFETIKNLYQISNLSSMNPGSGEADVWPIKDQKNLFSLFGELDYIFEKVGVRLLPSYLMMPEISSSGIIFPSHAEYVNCKLCRRNDCPDRRARFDKSLWESIHRNE